MIDPEDIRRRIESALPGCQVSVRDLTGGGDHYEAVVVSDRFRGLSLIEQHRLVYAPLRDVLGGDLHALSLKTSAA